ncbi:hypothetical protein [Streptomyces marincola]|uniref:hypothetical protein n=1 Tax=Streptomyces marincola TaxID=2878388 RepID=UPI001CF303A6|nr:hypothetical protein [Streptomyces marincola]UCM91276.1 hypothetical protein LC193_26875 [Streptomyces marincola]
MRAKRSGGGEETEMAAGFTVDMAGAEGMRAGAWTDGEEFVIRCDGSEEAAARVRLEAQDGDRPAVETRPVTVAEVEARLRAGGTVAHPALALTHAAGAPLATVRPEERVPWPRRFAVTDAAGRPLCAIARAPSRFGRGHWRIIPADGGPHLVGRDGTAAGWAVFVLLLPLWLVLFAGSLLVALLTFGHVAELLGWSRPQSVAWRRRGAPPWTGRVLTFSHLRTGYRRPGRAPLDERVAYAQAALHHFSRMHHD